MRRLLLMSPFPTIRGPGNAPVAQRIERMPPEHEAVSSSLTRGTNRRRETMGSPKYLSRILAIDVEATCWRRGNPPPGQKADIISIGVAPIIIPSMTIGLPEIIFVKPERSTISGYCTELTGITQEVIDINGILFSEACYTLVQDYGARHSTWVAWGNWDRRQFRTQTYDTGVEYPFGLDQINLDTLFSLARGETHAYGVREALTEAGLTPYGVPHDAGDDAYDAAQLFVWTMKVFRTGMQKMRMDTLKEKHGK